MMIKMNFVNSTGLLLILMVAVGPIDSAIDQQAATNVSGNCDTSTNKSQQQDCATPKIPNPLAKLVSATTTLPTVKTQKPPVPTTARSQQGLITRTTDAIYKVLSSVFKRDDDDGNSDDDEVFEATTQIYNSTRRTTTIAPIDTTKISIFKTSTTTTKSPAPAQTSSIKRPSNSTTSKAPATEPYSTSTATSLPLVTSTTTSTATFKPITSTTRVPKQASSKPPTIVTSTASSRKQPEVSTSLRPISTTTTQSHDEHLSYESSLLNDTTNSSLTNELYAILNNALSTIYKLRETTLLNRSTRVAPKHEPDLNSNESFGSIELAKLQDSSEAQNDGRAKINATDELHLLCKLLHKHFDAKNAIDLNQSLRDAILSTTTTIAPTSDLSEPIISSTTIRPQKATTTVAAATTTTSGSKSRYISNPSLDLSDPFYERYLLETIFSLDESHYNQQTESALRKASSSALSSLYNAAADRKRGREMTRPILATEHESLVSLSANTDYDSEEKVEVGAGDKRKMRKLSRSEQNATFEIKTYRRASSRYNSHFHLVYWLIESSGNQPIDSQPRVFKLVNVNEANDLIEQNFEREEIKKHLEPGKLDLIGNKIATTYKKLSESDRHHHLDHYDEPHVIDDTLDIKDYKKPSQSQQQPTSSGFQLLIDRLSSKSFNENLQLYLIIFLISLVAIFLCLVIPMICYKAKKTKRQESINTKPMKRGKKPAPQGRRRVLKGQNLDSGEPQSSNQRISNISANLPSQPMMNKQNQSSVDSIWRKLSNTTTTLVNDQSDMIRDDGSIGIPIVVERGASHERIPDNSLGIKSNDKKSHQFEWYSFEDRVEQQERDLLDNSNKRYYMSDKRQFTKSVQTIDNLDSSAFKSDEQLLLEYKSRLENKSTNTLTKSELVMLKEKMIPVNMEPAASKQQVASQTSLSSESGHDYVNQALLNESKQQTNRQTMHLDSSQFSRPIRSFIDSSKSPTLDTNDFTSPSSSQTDQQQASNHGTVIGGPAGKSVQINDDRIPKMRHLELEPKTRGKVDAIKAELSKLEQRDQQQSRLPFAGRSGEPSDSTYRRYDVT